MRRSTLIAMGVCAGIAGSASAATLNANPGPANNGLSAAGAGLFFDLMTNTNLMVTHLTTANTGAAGAAFTFEVYTRLGSGLGGPVGSGPGSSLTGWTLLGTANGTQGATANGVSLQIDIPDINLIAGQVTGVALRFTSGAGPRYFGTGSPPLENYTDGTLSLVTGDSRSAAFTTGGTWFSSRALVGSLTYEIPTPGAASLLAIAGLTGIRRRR